MRGPKYARYDDGTTESKKPEDGGQEQEVGRSVGSRD